MVPVHNEIDVMGRQIVNGDLVAFNNINYVHGVGVVYDNMLYTAHQFIDSNSECLSYMDVIDLGYDNMHLYKIRRELCTQGSPEKAWLDLVMNELAKVKMVQLSKCVRDKVCKQQKLKPGYAYLNLEPKRQRILIYLGRCGFMDTELNMRTGHALLTVPVYKPVQMFDYGRPPLTAPDFAEALADNMYMTADNNLSTSIGLWVKMLTNVPSRMVAEIGPVNLPTSGSINLMIDGQLHGVIKM